MSLGLAPIPRLYLYPTSVSERQHRRLAPLGDGGAFRLSVEASRHEAAGDAAPEQSVGFRLDARW